MNSIDEKLLKYFENEMSDHERKEFEAVLLSNPDLLKKLNEFQKVSSSFSAYNNVEVDERYFSNLIPRFNEKKKSKISLFTEYLFRPVYLYPILSSAAAVIIIFITLNSINKVTPFNFQTVASEMQENEINEQLNSIKEDYYSTEINKESIPDSIVGDYYYSQITESPDQVSEYITSTSGYTVTENSIYNDLSDEEADKIYNELINKKIL